MSKTLDLLQAQGLVAARYNFKNGSLLDLSGNGNHLTAANSPKWVNTKRGRGVFHGPGSTAATSCGDAASLRITEGIMILFGDFTQQIAQQRMIQIGVSAATGVLFYSSSVSAIAVYDGSSASVLGQSIIGKKMLAVRFKTGKIPDFFVDGAMAGVGNLANTFSTPNQGLFVGNGSTPGNPFQNPITDAILLNSATVTDQQIAAIYGEVMAEKGIVNGAKTNLHYSAPPDTAVVPSDGSPLGSDMDMDLSTKLNWTDFQGVSSKVLGTRTGGTGTRVMQLDFDGVNASGLTYQNIPLTIGKNYRVRGWFRGDGTAIPLVGVGAINFYTGTSSTTWQYFDCVLKCATDGYFRLQCNNLTAGHYVQWDECSVVETQELVSDGNMESSGAGAWASWASGTPTKQTTNPNRGTQLLRLTYGGGGGWGGSQTILTVGKRYRATGVGRSDGNLVPKVSLGGGSFQWTGTTSTSWQPFTTEFVADGTGFYLGTTAGSAGQYVEFDDISVKEVKCLIHYDMTTLTGDGKMLDRSGNGNHGTVTRVNRKYTNPFDASKFNGNVLSNVKLTSGLALIASNQQFAYSLWMNPETLANNPIIFANGNAGNSFYLQITPSGAAIIIGGATRTYTFTTPLNHWTHFYFEKTGAGDLGNLYVNNVLQSVAGGTLGSTPAFTESLLLGTWYAATYELSGSMADFRLYSSNLTAAERTKLYLDGAKRLVNRNCLCDAAVTLANVTAGQIPTTNFEVASGTWSLGQNTTAPFDKWMSSATSGPTGDAPNTLAYGWFQFNLNINTLADTPYVMPISSVKGAYTVGTQNGYLVYIPTDGGVYFCKVINGTLTTIFVSTLGIIQAGTTYTIGISRGIGGVFTVYIKGGAFTSWTKLTATAGSNPVTNNEVISSRYVKYSNQGTHVSKFNKFFALAGVIDPTVNPELIPN